MPQLNTRRADALSNYDFTTGNKGDNAAMHNNKGIIYLQDGENDQAIASFSRAIQLDPHCAQAYNNRGAAYGIKGAYNKTIADCTAAIRINPNYAEAYKNRGNAYKNKGEYDRAIEDYSQAIVQKPKVAKSYYTRGEAYLHIGKWEEAQRDLTAAILQGVDIAEAFHNIHNSIAAFEEQVGVKLPEDIVALLTPRQESFEIDKNARVALAMQFYENEELSSGLAARLAGVSREEFWYLMRDYGLSLFGTAEDLRAELENVHKASH